MEWAHFYGQTVLNIMESTRTTSFQEKVDISSLTDLGTMEHSWLDVLADSVTWLSPTGSAGVYILKAAVLSPTVLSPLRKPRSPLR